MVKRGKILAWRTLKDITMLPSTRAALFTVLTLYGFSASCQVSVAPPNPVQLETVRVRIPQGGLGLDQMGFPDSYRAEDTLISMSGNTITVSLLTVGNNGFQLVPSLPLDLPIGQFPAGSYSVLVTRRSEGAGTAGSLGLATFNVSPRGRSDPLWNFTDLWWNPSESGWGINLVQHPSGVIFATWFVYGPDGKPIWYAIPDGDWVSPTEYRGVIYRTTGPFFGGPFSAAAVAVTPVGNATINFVFWDFESASFQFTIDGATVTKQIQRQSF
jgi:hypothetical protein